MDKKSTRRKAISKPQTKPKIKAIIFDLGGVIMHGGYLFFIQHYLGKRLSAATRKRIEHLEHEVNLGTISENQFYRHIQKEFDVHLEPKQIHALIVSKMRTNKELIHYIPKLKKAKIALFSNSIGYMAMETLRMRRLAGRRIFDRIFLSNVLHLAKPTRDSFEYVVHHLKVKPHEALMVDDRPLNVAAARKVGLHGIVFKNTTQLKKALKKYELA
jgi:HAD superfamily hydrolase (TIGR01509 family)